MPDRKREESEGTEDGPVPIKAGVEDAWLAGNVRERRESLGYSQGEVARRMAAIGWPWYQQTTRRVEDGTRKVSAGEAAALARILGTTVTRLMMPGEEASFAFILDDFTGRAHAAYATIARGAATLQFARRQLALTIGQAKRSPHAGSPQVAALIRDAAEACGLDAADAIAEGEADLDPDEEGDPE